MVPDFLLTYGPNISFILGLSNLIFMVLVFFSCRCIMGKRITEFLWKQSWYQKFYVTHGWWWWAFFVSVGLHVIVTMLTFGLPRL